MASNTLRLTDKQRETLSDKLQELDMATKSELYHEAETAVKKDTYFYSASEYVYDKLFPNELSSFDDGE